MERLERAAVLTQLITRLRESGSWCGETHLQKSVLFLQELLGVPLGFNFIIYKHGPFSFQLREDLSGLRADELVRLESQLPYGARYQVTEVGECIQKICSETLKSYSVAITFVANCLGNKRVSDLEGLATALFLTSRSKEPLTVDERAALLRDIKPHISRENAERAVVEVDGVIEKSQASFVSRGLARC